MSYPFAQAPTVADFIERAVKEKGAEIRRTKSTIKGPRGAVSAQYLYRKPKTKQYFTEPLPTDMEERLAPDTLRRLCKQLGISPKDFGYELG